MKILFSVFFFSQRSFICTIHTFHLAVKWFDVRWHSSANTETMQTLRFNGVWNEFSVFLLSGPIWNIEQCVRLLRFVSQHTRTHLHNIHFQTWYILLLPVARCRCCCDDRSHIMLSSHFIFVFFSNACADWITAIVWIL